MKPSIRIISGIILLMFVCAAMLTVGARSGDSNETMSELLEKKLDDMNSSDLATIMGEPIEMLPQVTQFYQNRSYLPAWSENGIPLPQTDSLVTAIQDAHREGLEPKDYHLIGLEDALAEARHMGNAQGVEHLSRVVEMDCLFTDAFLKYASHLLIGRTNPPEGLKVEDGVDRRIDLITLTDRAVEGDCIISSLEQLLPMGGDYWRLRKALAMYQGISQNGGWTVVPTGPVLGVGVIDGRVQMLRDRLSAELGSTQDVGVQSDTFDHDLRTAVRRFQKLHGLPQDGVVDAITLAALNTPVERRIHQIEINMERWRWMQHSPIQHSIVVNIANFDLRVIESDSVVLSMKVIVGKNYKPTPVFASEMTHMIVNPVWNVPKEIAVNEIAPAAKRNAQYLAQEHFTVYRLEGGKKEAVDPTTVNWATVNADTLKFEQQSGPFNALGRLKFVFPNKYDVYIHGTPAQSLFRRNVREFSHGCVRIEHPLELANYVLRDDSSWTTERLMATIEKGIEVPIKFPEPIPVYVLYLTAWVENSGEVQFRNDIYDLDNARYRALISESNLTKESRTTASSIQKGR